MLAVLAIAFATSFTSGTAGARLLGYPGVFATALPLVCDIVAGLATVVHSRARSDPPMRRLAARFVLAAMALSWAANSVDHVVRSPAGEGWSGTARAAWVVGVVVAAGICPVAVAALLHLSTRYVEFEQRETARAAAGLDGATAAARPSRAVRAPSGRRPAKGSSPSGAATDGSGPSGTATDEVAARRERDRLRKAAQREAARRARDEGQEAVNG